MSRILGAPNTPERIGWEVDNFMALVTAERDSDNDEVEEAAQLTVLLPAVERDVEDLPFVVVVDQVGHSEPTPEDLIVVELEDESSMVPGHDQHYLETSEDAFHHPRSRWTGKMKDQFLKLPEEVQRATCRCTKATKQFS
jgi:hypothetical protein